MVTSKKKSMLSDGAFPGYIKICIVFLGIFALVACLMLAQSVIVPLLYAVIIAIALDPLVLFFVRKKIPHVAAITITLTAVILAILIPVVLLSSQLSLFLEAFPRLVIKFHSLLDQLVNWCSGFLNIGTKEIETWINIKTNELLKNSNALIGQTLVNTGNILVVIFILPVYVFLILYYKHLLIAFIHKLFSTENNKQLTEVISSTKSIVQSYIIGLLLEAAIVAILNSCSLLLIGIEYAILLGVLGAVLNVIPYIGGMIALAINMIIALATASPMHALLVCASFFLIQMIDNNYIMPKLVASRVKLNALMSILVVIIAGEIWGVSGMFLAIPITAILKVIFDHVHALHAWGYLLGESAEATRKK